MVVVEMVAGSIASLNWTFTAVVGLTPDCPAGGVTDETVGGVVSGPMLVTNTTSTQ